MKRGENLRKHGLSGTPEHRAWCGMMTRCYWSKPGDRNYDLYRGAGIVVAECWHDFTNFLADMGPKPSSKHSLDRHPIPSGNSWEREAREHRERKSDSVDAAWFLLWLMLGATLVAAGKALVEWLLA